MKLKSLRLHGFKSFADRTDIEFRDGITAVIGSNGCGKSNIADAIRWVLGEQRASAIRGAKMEEAIFQGTARRRPLNFAEVSLNFDNEAGRVAVPQREIEVSRKVFREGGSEYALNRNACRLRDVHDLLRDTGLGSNAYAIMEAGMIETLLSDRAEERRLLFEEAAGIGRYKDSRQAALRRLESAEADLARLGDLIAEVESKVRALARQKRKAERHTELHARRLQLDVAIARGELAGLAEALHDAERRMAELEEARTTASAERSGAEARVEEQRLRAADLARQRGEVAARAEAVRRDLDAREREVLVAEERRRHAEMRIDQLRSEVGSHEARTGALAGDIERLGGERSRREQELAAARVRLASWSEVGAALRDRLQRARAEADSAGTRSHDLARELATAEGERAAAERRAREANARIDALEKELAGVRAEIEELSAQTMLWSARADELRGRVEELRSAAAAAASRRALAIDAERGASVRAREAEDALSRLRSQVEARELLERQYEGFAPAVAALMSRRPAIDGVIGPLADHLPDSELPGAAIETHLGPLFQALVVRDLGVARAVRAWFFDEWSGGGTLLLLPLDALGAVGPTAWGERLLERIEVVSGDPLSQYRPGVTRIAAGGVSIDSNGVVRFHSGEESRGILARREELVRLREDLRAAASTHAESRARRDEARAALEAAERQAAEADSALLEMQAELRTAEADASAHEHRSGRLDRDEGRLATEVERARSMAAHGAAQLQECDEKIGQLRGRLAEVNAADEAARAALTELQREWESARDEESELRVEVARAEARLGEADRSRAEAIAERDRRTARAGQIQREIDTLAESMGELSSVVTSARARIDELFAARDEETARLALLDGDLAELDSDLAELAERARSARQREQEAADLRHKTELAIADSRSRVERVRERLEVEWGRPWSALEASAGTLTDGGPQEWRSELREIVEQIDKLGPVNMLAVEEHDEEARRLAFLVEQRDDLTAARDDLVAAIRQINRTARELFLKTFESVRENFQRVFQSLFEGGQAEIRLADPDDPLESLVEIQASPKGKRTQRIHLLSGGERTLTALALLFALYLEKPSPFCVLDEVDAPLDESNLGRFIQLLRDFKADTQFIVITHHPRTMEAADWVYGVTMEEPGVSTIVGVELVDDWTAENRVA